MKYVMSDIHGCYDKFIEMLKLINFQDTDELYIIGDIFDRGKQPLAILDYIVDHKNITLLKGNHEQMYLDYHESNDISLWFYNGGMTTYNDIFCNRSMEFQENLYKYIKKLPFIKVVDKFILVHSYLYLPKDHDDFTIDEIINMQDEEDCLWDRSNIGHERKYRDYKIICGHTPVPTITNDYENITIINQNETYYIDCGCVFSYKLACLRLDDMKEFYV